MARLINDTGILGDTIVEVSTMTKQGNFDQVVSFDVVVDAIHAVQEEMGITGTTAAEAAGTIEGSVASMKAAWSNWLVGLGDPNADLSGLTDNLIGSFETVVSNVIPVVERIGISLTQVFSDLSGIDLSGVTNTISSAFDGITEAVEKIDFSGVVSGIGEAFSGIAQTISSAFDGVDVSGHIQSILDIIGSLATGIGDMLSQIDLSGFGAIFTNAQTMVSTAWQGIISAIDFEAVGSAINTAVNMVSVAVQSLQEAFQAEGISGAAATFVETIIAAFIEVGPRIAETSANIISSIGSLITMIAEYLYSALPASLQGLVDAISNVFGSIVGYLQELWAWMQPLLTFFTSTFVNGIQSAWAQLGIIIETLIGALTASLDFLAAQFDIVTALMQGDFESAADAITQAWDAVLDFFGTVANGIMDLFTNLAGSMADIGRNMWEGLKNGFSGALDWAKSAGNSIKNGFKDVFDINSPSRVFAEYGKYMAQGLEQGWNSETGSLMRTMSDGLVMRGKVDFANSAIGRASAATINGMMSSDLQNGGIMNINLTVDGRTLAQVVFDPLNGLIKQKGVALGA